MREVRHDAAEIAALVRKLGDLLAALPDRHERGLVLSYILEVAEAERPEVEAALAGAVPPSVREDVVVTVADQLRREGQAQALRRFVLRLLRVRFGELPADVETRVLAADVPELEAWGERVVTATTLADVFAGPAP